ncbi:MAG: response regulator transcription factor [Candidatus Eisenbacteria bacterium]|uniref:Response regulator transcription factor n=1 Tax=Eiseniibacteriota bacterium TaxID=2212470 RepID=A0A538T3G2_UNCEI|nr:MAG: response regulator transcription factor [Candidatus Eisenbacteria bacterium]
MKVLVIEDSGPTRDLLVRALRSEQIAVETSSRLSTGLRQAMTGRHDVIVLDLMLPDGDGLQLTRELKRRDPAIEVIVITAYGSVRKAMEATKGAGAFHVLEKPFDPDELLGLIENALEHLEALVAKQGRVVGRTDLLENVWHAAGRHESDSLDVILSRLRRKLGGDGEGCAIRTIRGEGFVFEVTT